MTNINLGDAVVITTEARGIFFGYLTDDSRLPDRVDLDNARNCIYWSAETRGVLGLAANGPAEGSRITEKIPTLRLYKITGVFKCTPAATESWEKGIWS